MEGQTGLGFGLSNATTPYRVTAAGEQALATAGLQASPAVMLQRRATSPFIAITWLKYTN